MRISDCSSVVCCSDPALAQLTRDIHAPLANRLGIWQLKWELEDLAFRHLDPDTYRRIARLLDDKRTGRERYIAQVTATLRDALAAQGVDAEVAGRPKHIYSIWKKMRKKDVPIGELYDLRAVRVLVDDIPACYAALGVAHALWAPIPSEFDDYIARPKHNDYRSLHTAVVGPEGKTLEVQIRTREMHEQAELGVAAHWRYKETGGSQRSAAGNAALDRKIGWMRRLLEASSEGAGELAGGLDTELVEDRIYVLTPRGEVVDLPRGATPLRSGGKALGGQIRTRERHKRAERGLAAHWRYKETGGSQRSAAGNAALDRKIGWMRRLLEASSEGAGELAGGLDTELVEDRIYVLTPRGEVVDLPRGATPLDFAYHVHTDVGHRCRGAKVDGRIVPLDPRLRSGDRVEILPGKVSEPRRDWLVAANGFLPSARSRAKVRPGFQAPKP